jgi:diguanylate cyclase (GGDEF)-like protein
MSDQSKFQPSEALPDAQVIPDISDEQYQTLFQLPMPCWCWHVSEGRIEVNGAFQNAFSCNPDRLDQLLNIFCEKSREGFLETSATALRTARGFSLQVSLNNPSTNSGLNTDRFLWAAPIQNETGKTRMLGMLFSKASHDVTDNSRFPLQSEYLLDSIKAAILYFDHHGRIRHGNQKAFDWLPRATALGSLFSDVALGWHNAIGCQQELEQVMATGVPMLDRLENRTEDGQQFWYRVDKLPTFDDAGVVHGALLVMNDVTDLVLKEQALKESEARYKAFIANSSEAMYRFDLEPPVDVHQIATVQIQQMSERARLAECNHVLAKFFGAVPDNMLGVRLAALLGKHRHNVLPGFVDGGYRLVDQDFSYINNDGDKLSFQVSAIGIIENGYLQRVWGTARDVTERQRYLDRLEYQATHDSLTLLPNRNHLYQELERLLRQRAETQQLALMLLDLDRFKEINDTLGHHVGDKLLKQIGPRLEMELSELPAMVARLGGDEFAILLPRIRNNQQAVVIGHRVLDAIRQPFEVEGLHTEISVSVGIAICPDQADDVSTLMRYADVAMYHAKSERKGVSVYQVEHDTYTPKRLALMSDLGRAIREDQLQLYFQPKVDLAQSRVFGFEALLRWQHPVLGFVPPGEFIPLVEMTDLVNPMTLWVLENAIAQAKQWQQQGYRFSVAANLSAQNLLGDALVDKLEELLSQYQLPAELLELEITESTIMADPDRALRVLKAIDGLGVTLAIDDFGTGYSSLAYLKRLPVRLLKIDGSFVTGMLGDDQDQIIVHSTINLAHNLGLKVVAEGVEDEKVLCKLQELGCDQVQGYHIARPQPAPALEQWLRHAQWDS